MRTYLRDIWASRHFWLHLATAELKYKFRRSKLGLLWTMINPLALTLMMVLIFGNIFNIPMKDFAPYVFSGLIVWDFVLGSVLGGCNSMLSSEGYIRQFKHPFAIYPLKTTLVNITTFLIALSGLMLWILIVNPVNLLMSLLALPLTIICYFILGWPISILTAFVNLKYRDFGQVIGLLMQMLWYMSPVFLQPSMFENVNLLNLIEYNPVTHILNLVRAPLLYGQFPTLVDFAFVLGTAVVLYAAAILRIRSSEKTLIYYF
jgi:lipopolysaccharide transport system permease protein